MPDLRGGNVAVELPGTLEDRQDAGGQHIAVFRQPAQPAAPRADRRELRRHVQRRQQDQEDDDRRRRSMWRE